MKKLSIEQRILAARPTRSVNNAAFTDVVMDKVREREIISSQFRTTNVNQKETFIMRLRNLHKPALVAIALAVTLATAGTAYAVYQLWPKPSVETSQPTINQTGRVETLAKLENCGNQQQNQIKYEIKKGSAISADQVPQILQAYCELQAIQVWAPSVMGLDPERFSTYTEDKAYDMTNYMASTVYRVESIDDAKVTLAGQVKYGIDPVTYSISDKTKIVIDATYGSATALKSGDIVMPVLKTVTHIDPKNHNSTAPLETKSTLTALVKLNLPFEAYDPRAQQSITERRECNNNAPDVCVSTGGVDLYMGRGTLPGGAKSDSGNTREIQGKIVSYDSSSIMIESTSGRHFTFKMKLNPIDDYNKNRSAGYNNTKIGVGDMIQVMYSDYQGSRSLVAEQSQITMMQYMIELVGKADSLKKY